MAKSFVKDRLLKKLVLVLAHGRKTLEHWQTLLQLKRRLVFSDTSMIFVCFEVGLTCRKTGWSLVMMARNLNRVTARFLQILLRNQNSHPIRSSCHANSEWELWETTLIGANLTDVGAILHTKSSGASHHGRNNVLDLSGSPPHPQKHTTRLFSCACSGHQQNFVFPKTRFAFAEKFNHEGGLFTTLAIIGVRWLRVQSQA